MKIDNDEKTNQDKPLILLVDDIPQNVQILHQILNSGEYSFAIATNGKETLRLVKKKLPDLILLDIMLGDIDGFEVCKRLKQDPKTAAAPIIFLTAKVGVEDKVKGFNLGAVDYITKPFEDAEVVARVRTHVQLKKSIDIIHNYNRQLSQAFAEMQQSYQDLKYSQEKLISHEKQNAVKAASITASHEMNQPLTVIQGYLDMLIDSLDSDSLDSSQQKYLNRIEEGLKKLVSIIENFRRHSHLYCLDGNRGSRVALMKQKLEKVKNHLPDDQKPQHF
jgi:DNA-binding response OmpR family regulator